MEKRKGGKLAEWGEGVKTLMEQMKQHMEVIKMSFLQFPFENQCVSNSFIINLDQT